MLWPRLLEVLRTWYPAVRCYLFPSWRTGRHVTSTSVQTAVVGSTLSPLDRLEQPATTPHPAAAKTNQPKMGAQRK